MTPPANPQNPNCPHDNALADLLCQLDHFLRSGNPALHNMLANFYADRGHPTPSVATCNLIDQLCFTAAAYHPGPHNPTTPPP